MTPCLSVCTRTKFRDYSWKGNCAKTFEEIIQKNPDWQDILKLVETTKQTVLLLENYLYVTGIPTDRKDKVGTAIRWSFLLEDERAKDLFKPLVNAFESGKIEQLGSSLDDICKVDNDDDVKDEYDQFQAPDFEQFLNYLKCLPDPEPAQPGSFKLWTDFVPEDEDKIQGLINSLAMPNSDEIYIYKNGKSTPYSKKFTIKPAEKKA